MLAQLGHLYLILRSGSVTRGRGCLAVLFMAVVFILAGESAGVSPPPEYWPRVAAAAGGQFWSGVDKESGPPAEDRRNAVSGTIGPSPDGSDRGPE